MAELYNKLIEHARKAGEPLDAIVELTYRCNYRCKFCYVDHSAIPETGELDSATWSRILEEMKAAGVISILFTGGEVFLRKDCLDILRKAKELGFLTTVFTNASRIDQSTAAELAALNLVNIGVTLYGATPVTHDNYSGVPGSFDRAISAVRTMKDRGCNCTLRWQAIPETTQESEAFIDLAESLGIPWKVNGLIASGRDGGCRLRVSDDELVQFYRTVVARFYNSEQLVEEAGRIASSLCVTSDPESAMCAIGTVGARIDPQGTLYPCMLIDEAIGNVTETPFAELCPRISAWAGCSQIRRNRFSLCDPCRYLGACSVCPGGFAQETGSYQQPTWEYCRNTLSRLQAIAERVDELFGRESNPLKKMLEEPCGLQNSASRR